MVENMNSKAQKRGLVIQGGGAKGAFALGCMKAFRESGIEFSAVSGTSAGGLCAIIWSTDRLDEGIKAWIDISHADFFGKTPEGCARRAIKILLTVGKLFAGFLKNVEPEGRPQFARDAFFSVFIGLLAWMMLPGSWPLWVSLLSLVFIPIVAFFAFGNELPTIGWDSRVRNLIVDTMVFCAAVRVLTFLIWTCIYEFGYVTHSISMSWFEIITNVAVVAALRLPIKIHATLMEGQLLAAKIDKFLKSELKIPTYVTVAEERPPVSPHFLLPTPGVFKAHYAALHKAPDELKAVFGYASAALPFGLLPQVQIGSKIFVDGGVADNTPALPMIMDGIDEIWVIALQPGEIDIREHIRNVQLQAVFADGIGASNDAFQAYSKWIDNLKIVNIAPYVSLGGLLTGTLNFTAKRTKACVRHGYRVATKAICEQNIGELSRTRRFNPKLSLGKRIKLIMRSLPPCSVMNVFARSEGNTDALRDFHMPKEARKPHGPEGSAAWSWSVMLIWALFVADSSAAGHHWTRLVWGTLIGLVSLSIPTCLARLRRNLS